MRQLGLKGVFGRTAVTSHNKKMTRLLIIYSFLFLLVPLATKGQTAKTSIAIEFDKNYSNLRQQFDTLYAGTLRDSISMAMDSLVINYFTEPTNFNNPVTPIKGESHYGFLANDQLRLINVDAGWGEKVIRSKTYLQFKGTTGKINLRIIDGSTTESKEDNFWPSDIYKLNSNLYLVIGNGSLLNYDRNQFYVARVFQIQGDSLIDYPAFNDKSYFTITPTFSSMTFEFDTKTKTLVFDYEPYKFETDRIKGKFQFNGNKFVEK